MLKRQLIKPMKSLDISVVIDEAVEEACQKVLFFVLNLISRAVVRFCFLSEILIFKSIRFRH